MKNEALIIVDMSNDFVADTGTLTAGKPAQEIVPYIRNLADDFLKNDGTVVVAMDAHAENDPHFELWPAHNVVGTEGQKLYGELAEWYEEHQSDNRVLFVPKENYNAFYNTGLGEELRKRGIDTVHVAGVCTDICNFLTVAGADAEGFKTVIHEKGSATFSDKGPAAIEHMKVIFHTEVI